jgi:hypothetical protein
VTPEQIERIAELRSERGWSEGRIARSLKVSTSGIYYICLSRAIDPPRPHAPKPVPIASIVHRRGGRVVRKFNQAEDAALLALEAEGLNRAQIGRRLGRKPNVVKMRLMTLARREDRAEALGDQARASHG